MLTVLNMLTYGSMILASLQLTSTYVISRKLSWGWLLGTFVICLAIPYDAVSHQWGYVATGAITLIVSLRAYFRWRGEKTPGGPGPA